LDENAGRKEASEGGGTSQLTAARLQATTRHNTNPRTRKNIFMTLSVNDVRYGSFSTKGKVMHHFRTLVFKTKQKEGEK
jgi:hypothetical protein